MAFTNKITNADLVNKGVIGLPDTPQLSTQAMQEKFEETARQVIIPKHNGLITELESNSGASSIGTSNGKSVQAEIDTLTTTSNKLAKDVKNMSQSSHFHENKALLDTYTQTNDDLASAVSLKHSHANKELLDSYTQTEADIKSAVDNKHTHANKELIDSYTQSDADIKDAINNKHSHTNKALLDTYTETNDNIKDAVEKKHNHTNKTILDGLSENDGKLNYKNQPISGTGLENAYSHIKVGSTTIDSKDDDTIELIAGSNVTLIPNATAKTITINSTGGGGTSTGDMTKAEFVLEGGSGQVLSSKKSDTVGNASTPVLEKLSDVDGSLFYNGSKIGTDVNIDGETIVTNESGELSVPIDDDTLTIDKTSNKLRVSEEITKQIDENTETLSDNANDGFLKKNIAKFEGIGAISQSDGKTIDDSNKSVYFYEYARVESGETYVGSYSNIESTGAYRYFMYDDNKGYLDTDTLSPNETFIIPSGVAFLRFQHLLSLGKLQFEKGSTPSVYTDYADSNAELTAKLSDNADWLKSRNIFDYSKIEKGGINQSTGAEETSNIYQRTPFISVDSNSDYTMTIDASTYVRYFYYSDTSYISTEVYQGTKTVHIPSNATRLRMQSETFTPTCQLEKGNVSTPYKPYAKSNVEITEDLSNLTTISSGTTKAIDTSKVTATPNWYKFGKVVFVTGNLALASAPANVESLVKGLPECLTTGYTSWISAISGDKAYRINVDGENLRTVYSSIPAGNYIVTGMYICK